MAENTIIQFCEKYQINWFPIILDIIETDKKDNFGFTKFKKDLLPINHNLYNNSRPSYKELNNYDLCKQRQKLIETTDIKFNAIWIDTNNIYQVDIDTPNPQLKLDKWLNDIPYFKSMTKPYGYHFFVKIDDFDTKNKNKYILKMMITLTFFAVKVVIVKLMPKLLIMIKILINFVMLMILVQYLKITILIKMIKIILIKV